MNKEIKMNYKKETKRCVMPKTYSEFKQMISKCYGIAEKEIPSLLISYTDDEEDKVLITSEFDFEQALIFMEKQKLNILRINIDLGEKAEYEVIDKYVKENSFDKSFKSNMVEEVKEAPKDLNNQTISSIGRETERTVTKMNEICNKIETMTITDKVQNVNTGVNTSSIKDDLKLIKENIKEITLAKNEVKPNNYENLIEELRKTENVVKIKPIVKEKKEAKQKLKPVMAFSNKTQEQVEVEKFGKKLKKSLETMLDEKLNKIKEKLTKKTMKKSMKLVEKFMSKKKAAAQNIETEINKTVHPHVSCDDCGVSPIVGHRYKCAVCHNFDFCEKCEEKNKDSHPHPFILIRTPNRAPVSVSVVVRESCPIIQKSIPFNDQYKLADAFLQNNNVVNNTVSTNVVNNNVSQSINSSIIVDTNELDATCVSQYLDVVVREDAKEILKTLRLKNNGKKSWPKPVYLACVKEASTIFGRSVPIKIKVDPSRENNVEIKLTQEGELKAGEYISVWQLQTEKKEFFGEKIVLLVKVKEAPKVVNNVVQIQENKPVENKIVVNSTNNNISQRPQEEIFESFLYQCQVEELKNAYDIRAFDDRTIKQAAIKAKGDLDLTFQLLTDKKK